MQVCLHACMYVCMYACMHACMHACMYVCMYACMCMCMCMSCPAYPHHAQYAKSLNFVLICDMRSYSYLLHRAAVGSCKPANSRDGALRCQQLRLHPAPCLMHSEYPANKHSRKGSETPKLLAMQNMCVHLYMCINLYAYR